MGGLLAALNSGKTSLSVNQKAIEIVGNNIANVNNEDYSRQTPVLSPYPSLNIGQFFVGTGVKISDIARATNVFLTNQLQEKYAELGEQEAKSNPLAELERVFSITENGLATEIDKFFDSWQKLSTNPSGAIERDAVVQQGGILADAFSDVVADLDSVQRNVDDSLVSKVLEINLNLKKLGELNGQISTILASGSTPNSFLDQRDAVLRDLSSALGVQVYEDGKGNVSVQLPGGVPLVQGTDYLSLEGTTVDGLTQFSIRVNENTTVPMSREGVGGEFRGMLDMRDVLIPGLRNDVDKLAYNIVTAVNAQHQAGVGLDSVSGRSFFSDLDPDPAVGIPNASRNMTVAITDIEQIAAGIDTGSGALSGDNSNVLLIAALNNQTVVDGASTFVDFYGTLVGRLGLEAAQNNIRLSGAEDTIVQLKNLRDGVVGVSVEEEMINLIQYQRGFEASAKLLSTIDSLMETVIYLKQ
ncbi:MAG: flagellar hook-associated protein FlgK [Deltaproteobacteria bacterium]|nr:flagellar hook-associated protein FlgK [Deltaproteobacteria bacterium]